MQERHIRNAQEDPRSSPCPGAHGAAHWRSCVDRCTCTRTVIENKSAYDYAIVKYPGHENKTASVNATMQMEEAMEDNGDTLRKPKDAEEGDRRDDLCSTKGR